MKAVIFFGIEEILGDFLKVNDTKIDRACFGEEDQAIEENCTLTNLSWQIETKRLSENIGVDTLWLINDLASTAYAIPFLGPEAFGVI